MCSARPASFQGLVFQLCILPLQIIKLFFCGNTVKNRKQQRKGEKMEKSLWAEGTLLPEFPSLKDKIKTDVLIIGGGMCGILCAHFLEQCGAYMGLPLSRFQI